MSDAFYTELLRKVEEVMVIDVYSHASSIPDNLLATLKEPEQGLYHKGGFKPVITLNDKCYHGNSQTPLKFDEVIDTQRNIYNENGELLLDAAMYRRDRKFYTTDAPMFGTAMRLATAVALKTVDEYCPKFKPSPNEIDYYRYIKPEFHYLVEENEYDEIFHPISKQVIDFVNNYNWNMFFHRSRGNALIIERGIDWRIYDWHRIQYEAAHPDEE